MITSRTEVLLPVSSLARRFANYRRITSSMADSIFMRSPADIPGVQSRAGSCAHVWEEEATLLINFSVHVRVSK